MVHEISKHNFEHFSGRVHGIADTQRVFSICNAAKINTKHKEDITNSVNFFQIDRIMAETFCCENIVYRKKGSKSQK